MAVEQEVIDGKLQTEGIDAQLSKGIQFETEEALNEWVGVAKTFVTKPKAIDEYTKEELEEILKNPTPTAKGLQGFADALRQKQTKQEPPKQPKEVELPEEVKAKLDKLDQFLGQSEKAQKESAFNAELSKHTNGLDSYEVELIKNKLTVDAKPEDIKKEVEAFRSYMVKKGFDGYKVGGGGKANPTDDNSLDEAVKRLKAKRDKQFKK